MNLGKADRLRSLTQDRQFTESGFRGFIKRRRARTASAMRAGSPAVHRRRSVFALGIRTRPGDNQSIPTSPASVPSLLRLRKSLKIPANSIASTESQYPITFSTSTPSTSSKSRRSRSRIMTTSSSAAVPGAGRKRIRLGDLPPRWRRTSASVSSEATATLMRNRQPFRSHGRERCVSWHLQ